MEKTEAKRSWFKRKWDRLEENGWYPFVWFLGACLGVLGGVKFGYQHGIVMFMLGAILALGFEISEKLDK